jgi:flavin-dependent dehydrogenase
MPMMMTAAGTITPARVFVIGAGVAGLQAIASAKRMGAVVHAYDVRPAVKEQIQSLGGKFVELPVETDRRRGQGRLRERARRRVLSQAARADGETGGGERCSHHHRGNPGEEVARAHHRRHVEAHAALAPWWSISPPSAAATST